MSEFDLSMAVDLFKSQKAAVNNLWTVYVAATFAAAGFSFSSFHADFQIAATIALIVGFWAFTIGNYLLLKQSLTILESVRKAIEGYLESKADDYVKEFKEPLRELTKTKNPVHIARTFHLIIDLCVTAIIIFSLSFGPYWPSEAPVIPTN